MRPLAWAENKADIEVTLLPVGLSDHVVPPEWSANRKLPSDRAVYDRGSLYSPA